MSVKKMFSLSLILLLLPVILCAARLRYILPNKIVAAQGSELVINTGRLVSSSVFSDDINCSVPSDSFVNEKNGSINLFTDSVGKYDVSLKLLGILPVKTLSVDVIDSDMLIPSGKAIGIKIHTEGVMLIKLASVESGGKIFTPAKDSGLQSGDLITKINSQPITNSDHFSSVVNALEGETFEVEYVRDGETKNTFLQAVLSDEGYKIGAWIRDSSAGIGTLTFIKSDGSFAALGHGISDIDTGELLSVSQGSITDCSICSVTPGQKGSPGELKGVLSNNDMGVIMKNSNTGIYGKCTPAEENYTAIKAASRFEVKTGAAAILCTTESEQVQEYGIEIEKIMTNSNDEKGMIIKVTDEKLLEKTGGIVQGMSGSPIIQDGKLVGAVTHVFINDPTRGYGIFIENMLDEVEKIG